MTIKTAKKFLLILMLAYAPCGHAQLQLSNPGFENWESTSPTARPTGWSSFPQADGTWAWAASTPQHYHRHGGRPGSTGSEYITIYSRSVLGVVANGNMTTGQIHAGSTNASSDRNYNYTHRGTDYCHPFSGTPDSMVVWVSYYAANANSTGSVRAYIHGDSDFQDPNDCTSANKYCGWAEAQFTRTTTSATTPSWAEMRVPFTYDGSATAHYILMSMTTNTNAGGGSTNDSLSVDDITFIYSAWLDGIAINGTPVSDFHHDQFHYSDSLPDLPALQQAVVTCTTQAPDAVVTTTTTWPDDHTCEYTLRVVAEDSLTCRTYQVTLSCPEAAPCDPVTEIVAEVSLNHATISWTAASGNSGWEVRYCPHGTDPADGTTVICDSTRLQLDDLPFNSAFELSVRAICGDSVYTDWSPAITFATEADTHTVRILTPAEDAAPVLTLYPNPATDRITLQAANGQSPAGLISIYDNAGHLLHSQPAQQAGDTQIELSDLPNGVYTVRLQTARSTASQRIVIAR